LRREGSFNVQVLEDKRMEMTGREKEEIIGYYTEDGNIYCIECINKNIRVLNEIDRAITAEDSEGTLLFCEGCEKEIK
jgi:hypothetical protein